MWIRVDGIISDPLTSSMFASNPQVEWVKRLAVGSIYPNPTTEGVVLLDSIFDNIKKKYTPVKPLSPPVLIPTLGKTEPNQDKVNK